MAAKGVSDPRPISAIVAESDIVVFSGTHCGFCSAAIGAIKQAGYSSRLSVVNADPEQRRALYDQTSSTSVPSIWVKGRYVGGCYDGPEAWMGITTLIENGKLATMLA